MKTRIAIVACALAALTGCATRRTYDVPLATVQAEFQRAQRSHVLSTRPDTASATSYVLGQYPAKLMLIETRFSVRPAGASRTKVMINHICRANPWWLNILWPFDMSAGRQIEKEYHASLDDVLNDPKRDMLDVILDKHPYGRRLLKNAQPEN